MRIDSRSVVAIPESVLQLSVDGYPDQCPICRKGVEPKLIHAFEKVSYPKRLQIVFLCPIKNCNSYFIATYLPADFRDMSGVDYKLKYLAPYVREPRKFGEIVSELSPAFCEIYNQAMAAEQDGLDQIYGVAYGKALEFLIKDYLVKAYPEKAEDIKKMFLQSCVKNYIDDPKVKKCAELATWLRNDETHYTRSWTDKDVQDLKKLIELTVNFIENVILAEQYKKDMKPNKM